MEMNGVRFVFSPAPEMWYEIADEEGMMVFDEYAIWYAYQPQVGSVAKEAADPYKKWSIWPKNLSTRQLIKEFTAWMQDRWNHPSVIVWDAQNETWAAQTGEAIRAVRKLDLSTGYGTTAGRPRWRPATSAKRIPTLKDGWKVRNENRQGKEPEALFLDDLAAPKKSRLPFTCRFSTPEKCRRTGTGNSPA
jgi:hypothetical protein